MPKEKIYKYPNPKKICISDSDLKLRLKEFKEAVRKEISFPYLLIVVPVFIAMFTLDFRDLWGFSGPAVRGAYTSLILIGTLSWLFQARNGFNIIYLEKIKKNKDSSDENWLKMNENDPSKKVERIKSECK